MTQRIHLMPGGDEELIAGLKDQGAEIVGADERPTGVVVTKMFAEFNLGEILEANPQVSWVQLPSAGIEAYSQVMSEHPDRTWTSAKGAYAKPVGEHGLLLTLAALRMITVRARATSWGTEGGISLNGLRCVVVGAGGVAAEMVRLYRAFDTHITVVRRTEAPLEGADETVTFDRLDEVLEGADVLGLAAAVTPATEKMIGRRQLGLLADGAVLANVGRGRLVDTDALVEALESGRLLGAGLDVTDPEPLPDGHPLWDMPNCMITPHTANTFTIIQARMGGLVVANAEAFEAGEKMPNEVNLETGY